jgi:hypothetical protein
VSRARTLANSTKLDADKLAKEMAAAQKSESETAGGVEEKDDAVESKEEELAGLLGEILEAVGGDLVAKFADEIKDAPPNARPVLEAGLLQLSLSGQKYEEWSAVRVALLDAGEGNPAGAMLAGPLNVSHQYGPFATTSIAVPAVQQAVAAVKSGKKKVVPPKAATAPEEYVTNHKASIHGEAGYFGKSLGALQESVFAKSRHQAAKSTLRSEFEEKFESGEDGEHNLYEPKNVTTVKVASTGATILEYDTYGAAHFEVEIDKSGMVTSVAGTNLSLKTAVGIRERGNTQRPPGWISKEELHASHVIADRFLGSGYKASANTVIASSHFNQKVMGRVEDDIVEFIKENTATTFDMKVELEWGELASSTVLTEIMKELPGEARKKVEAEVLAFIARVSPQFKRCMNAYYVVFVTNASTGEMEIFQDNTGPDAWIGRK